MDQNGDGTYFVPCHACGDSVEMRADDAIMAVSDNGSVTFHHDCFVPGRGQPADQADEEPCKDGCAPSGREYKLRAWGKVYVADVCGVCGWLILT